MKKYLLALTIFLFSLSSFLAQIKNTSQNSLNKTNTNDDYNYIAINQFKMWIGNNGMGSHNPYTDGAGLLWPGGENAALCLAYMDGLLWGGYIADSLNVNGSTYRWGLQAGKILSNGLADDPTLPKYRIYKIRKGWEEMPNGPTKDRFQKDYEEWPGNEGAPFYDSNNDGVFTSGIDKPLFLGDEVLWCVMNDLDPYRTLYAYGSMPIGLEIQMTVYGYTHSAFENVLFKKYRIINKSTKVIDSMYLGYLSDPDIGDWWDDYVGCDTLLNLAFSYNGDQIDDDVYGNNPPAIGYMLLQGTTIKGSIDDSAKINNKWVPGIKDQQMTSFSTTLGIRYSFYETCWTIPQDIQQINCLNGLICSGTPFINPLNNLPTKYPFSGNPVDSTGWYMGYGFNYVDLGVDPRMYVNSSPITMAPVIHRKL